jgi:hypothetical protein
MAKEPSITLNEYLSGPSTLKRNLNKTVVSWYYKNYGTNNNKKTISEWNGIIQKFLS